MRVGTFPISIDARGLRAAGAAARGPSPRPASLRADETGRRIVLGVDRLDYTKGIPQKLEAFRTAAARRHPELRGQRHARPDRRAEPRGDSGLPRASSTAIERLVGEINGTVHAVRMGARSTTSAPAARGPAPVGLLPRRRRRARDAAQGRHESRVQGVLRDAGLERTACSCSPSSRARRRSCSAAALLVNPYDVEGVADTLRRALDMPRGGAARAHAPPAAHRPRARHLPLARRVPARRRSRATSRDFPRRRGLSADGGGVVSYASRSSITAVIGDLHTAALVAPGRDDRLALPAALRLAEPLRRDPGRASGAASSGSRRRPEARRRQMYLPGLERPADPIPDAGRRGRDRRLHAGAHDGRAARSRRTTGRAARAGRARHDPVPPGVPSRVRLRRRVSGAASSGPRRGVRFRRAGAPWIWPRRSPARLATEAAALRLRAERGRRDPRPAASGRSRAAAVPGAPGGAVPGGVSRDAAFLAGLDRAEPLPGPLARDGQALLPGAEAADLRARRARSWRRRRRACPSGSAASATGTIATPGCATRRSRSTHSCASASPRRRGASCEFLEARCRELDPERGPAGPLRRSTGARDMPEEIARSPRGLPRLARPCASATAPRKQFQLDIVGDLMDAVYLYNKYGEPISHDALEGDAARWRTGSATTGSEPDEGIWEVRGGPPAVHVLEAHVLGRARPRAADRRRSAASRRTSRGGSPRATRSTRPSWTRGFSHGSNVLRAASRRGGPRRVDAARADGQVRRRRRTRGCSERSTRSSASS